MSEDEIWSFLVDGHTGILTTLRRDGQPISLPLWYAVVDRKIYAGTRGKKVTRLQHDSRCSFLVEQGERWAELQAVHLVCEGRVVEPDEKLAAAIGAELQRKYAAFTTQRKDMPTETQKAYSVTGTTLELTPVERILNWDNRKLGL